ncbi:glutamate racemase [Natranaerofaba carboxydovora]|uniref:glutamate racemase n=1 Tax=Natranaerofaba carboxydovora TaxID=2742683 RepID=UPI001F12AAD9|nr:glutamate racemase [Natranaerofaba carboxydovora]UMZ72823.1 Glutamate racemase [Natranaerofaba carboxydovora]
MKPHKAIALIDSGVGGLTVAKEVMNEMPNEKLIYFGDLVHMPYGPRSKREVKNFVYKITEFLIGQDIKMVIVACNSASAAGLNEIRNQFEIPVIGVIEPGARAAIKNTESGKVGVIGTTGTIESGAYEKAIKRIDPFVEVYSKACPLFVLIVENDLIGSSEALVVAKEYLRPLKEEGVDTLILGCTHYPLMRDVIQEVMGPEVKLINSAKVIAKKAGRILKHENLIRVNEKPPRHRFYVSGYSEKFQELGKKFLHHELKAYEVKISE